MKSPAYPVTDDHIHIDPVNGRGIEAAKDFLRAGGRTSFSSPNRPGRLAFTLHAVRIMHRVFDETLRVAEMIREIGHYGLSGAGRAPCGDQPAHGTDDPCRSNCADESRS